MTYPVRHRRIASMTLMTLIAGLGAGLIAAPSTVLPVRYARILEFPLPALIAAFIGIAVLPLVLRDWRVGFWLFIVWLPFEDLVRKYAGNDIRTYIVKDLLFCVALVGLARHLRDHRAWRNALGSARTPLLALLGLAIAMSAPAVLRDWRLPLIGMRLNFGYAPLVAVGYFLALDLRRLRRTLMLLGLLAAAVLMLGVIQTVIGPSFLSPRQATPGLSHLVLIRRDAASGASVYRPTGTFVDPSRYASMALIGLTIALAVLSIRLRRLTRAVVLLAFVPAALAVWGSGGRSTVVVAIMLVVAAILGQARHRTRRIVTAGVLIATSLGAFAILYPKEFDSRFAYYWHSLDPRSSQSEWAFRGTIYTRSFQGGLALGGPFGHGTGTQSLGQQYVFGGASRDLEGLYPVENGYATVAYEWGWFGLAFWVIWSYAWTRRLFRCVREVRNTALATAAWILTAWIAALLFAEFYAGVAFFQNYVSNAYFWLFSGMVFGMPIAVRSRTSIYSSSQTAPTAAVASTF